MRRYQESQVRTINFNVGFIVACAFALMAFEWQAPIRPNGHITSCIVEDDIYELMPITFPIKKPKVKVKPKPIFDLNKPIEIVETLKVEAIEARLALENEPEINIGFDIDETEIEDPEYIATVEYASNPPEFPTGEAGLMRYLARTPIPTVVKEGGESGIVYVSFVVDEYGEIIDVRIEKGMHPAMDKSAINWVKKMPRWKPGHNNGIKIHFRYKLPIRVLIR